MQKLHGFSSLSNERQWTWRERFGSPDAIANGMNVSKRKSENGGSLGVLGRVSWIADELIGIRAVEQRLSKKLQSTLAANNRVLLDGIRDLNTRVDLLDRALDEYSRTRRAA